MINVIFTIDYEIYGNGEGSLNDHILLPTYRLKKVLDLYNVKLVFFVEAAELQKIEEAKSDSTIDAIKGQIKTLYAEGHEIALHLHPQWYNARYVEGKWQLDYAEYNLCTQPPSRIAHIIEHSIDYFRSILDIPNFTPLSFRSGNWLFQPTGTLAKILAEHGINIDSSVFKGGLQHQHHLDYRPALQNGYFWRFKDDVNQPDTDGELIEIPIYTKMVPPWQMATKKRLGLQQKAAAGKKTVKEKIYRLLDIARPLQPLKLDFCRMTLDELTDMMDRLVIADMQDSQSFKPIVAIGHTKDLIDFETIEHFLSYLEHKGIMITTFGEVYKKCL